MELTRTRTADGIRLHGLLYRSVLVPPTSFPDLLIFVHGVGSNFYQSTILSKIWPKFKQHGISILSVNTRGHDFLFSAGTGESQRWLGSANERIEECHQDIDAWLQTADELGFQKIGLMAHSLGAIKSIYSQALHQHSRVQRIIAISPSCLSYSYFVNSSNSRLFQESFARARSEINAGRGDSIMRFDFPFPLMLTPHTFVDKYGEQENYNILKFVNKVSVPMIVVTGEKEVRSDNPAYENLDRRLESVVGDNPKVDLQVIPDADHHYVGTQLRLADAVISWLSKPSK